MNYCNLYYSALKWNLLSSPGVLGNGTTIPAGVAKGPQVEHGYCVRLQGFRSWGIG